MKSFSPKEGVPGFLASGIAAGIKKNRAKDLALLLATKPCVAAGVFTRNRVQAAPVKLCKQRIKKGIIQAVLVNSGNANACAGEGGIRNAELTCRETAVALGIKENLVVPCSTGVIGVPLPTAIIRSYIPHLVKTASAQGIPDFAQAILTTDTNAKVVTRCEVIDGRLIKICGIAKGSGMIMPQMATMLAFVITNASISQKLLSALLKSAAEETFNRITVDGETSTNDTLLVMASGLAKREIVETSSLAYKKFALMLREVLRELSVLIVRDGEGATKLITITVKNAKNLRDARNAAFRVANSSLVKTACFGGDYNWGRIMAALGNSGAFFNPEQVDIAINNIPGVRNGLQVKEYIHKLKNAFKKDTIHIIINLNSGRGACEVLTCDLGYDYIKINASYTS